MTHRRREDLIDAAVAAVKSYMDPLAALEAESDLGLTNIRDVLFRLEDLEAELARRGRLCRAKKRAKLPLVWRRRLKSLKDDVNTLINDQEDGREELEAVKARLARAEGRLSYLIADLVSPPLPARTSGSAAPRRFHLLPFRLAVQHPGAVLGAVSLATALVALWRTL
jgi:chromosome segregation ATPase